MIFYPSCTVRLLVRFDELAGRLRAAPDARRQLNDRIPVRQQLEFCPISQPARTRDQMPVAITGQVDDLTHVVETLPKMVAVEQNSYRIADTARFRFPFRDFPYDPRIVRACAVEVYLGAVSPQRFALSNGAEFVIDGAPPPSARFGPLDGPPVFVGAVDNWISSHDASGEYVELHARDLTQAFLDTSVACHIDERGTLRDALERILRLEGAAWEGVQLEIRTGTGAEEQRILALIEGVEQASLFTRVKKGADGQTPKMATGQNLNWWDVVTILCVNAGLVPTVELARDQRSIVLAVSTPKALVGEIPGEPRKLIYGRNLLELVLERKLGGVRVPAWVVVGWDPDTKTRLVAKAPKDLELGPAGGTQAQTANTVSPSGQVQTVNARTQIVHGIKDQAALQRIADSLYELTGRQELTGRIGTRDLLAFSSVELTPEQVADGQFGPLSMLSLRSGDPVEILVAADLGGTADRSEYGAILGMSEEALATSLRGKGYPADVAASLASYIKSDGLQTIFRVRNVRTTFTADQGVRFDVDFANFYEVRETGVLRDDQTSARAAQRRAGPGVGAAGGTVTRGISPYPGRR